MKHYQIALEVGDQYAVIRESEMGIRKPEDLANFIIKRLKVLAESESFIDIDVSSKDEESVRKDTQQFFNTSDKIVNYDGDSYVKDYRYCYSSGYCHAKVNIKCEKYK